MHFRWIQMSRDDTHAKWISDVMSLTSMNFIISFDIRATRTNTYSNLIMYASNHQFINDYLQSWCLNTLFSDTKSIALKSKYLWNRKLNFKLLYLHTRKHVRTQFWKSMSQLAQIDSHTNIDEIYQEKKEKNVISMHKMFNPL